jgi:hypothetical protein
MGVGRERRETRKQGNKETRKQGGVYSGLGFAASGMTEMVMPSFAESKGCIQNKLVALLLRVSHA